VTVPTIRVVTVAFNSAAAIAACVRAVLDADGSGFELEKMVVVDNASVDGTADAVMLDPRVAVVRNAANIGFAAACNLGAREVGTDLLLFLNPDTRTGRDAIGRAARTLERHADAAVCGVRLAETDNTAGVCAARRPQVRTYLAEMLGLARVWPTAFPPALLRLDGRGVAEVDQVSGAFFLIRRELFDAFGGFDERYFLYYEEADLSVRLAEAGWRSVIDLDATCVHEGGGSSKADIATRLYLNLRSRITFARARMGRVRAGAVLLLTVVLEPVIRIAYVLVRNGSSGDASSVLIAYARLLAWLMKRSSAQT
jgi:N-acetylglucosaminyl-diphospho-decaprenol L-rhamnosyltransferase